MTKSVQKDRMVRRLDNIKMRTDSCILMTTPKRCTYVVYIRMKVPDTSEVVYESFVIMNNREYTKGYIFILLNPEGGG